MPNKREHIQMQLGNLYARQAAIEHEIYLLEDDLCCTCKHEDDILQVPPVYYEDDYQETPGYLICKTCGYTEYTNDNGLLQGKESVITPRAMGSLYIKKFNTSKRVLDLIRLEIAEDDSV